MSVAYARVSAATETDIEFYDRAALRRVEQLDLDTQELFKKSSTEILVMLEFGWWPVYVERTFGSTYYKSNAAGQTVTAFDPARLVKANQILVQLEVFKAVEILYSTLVTDNSNVNDKDQANLKYARERFEREWTKALQVSNFYDIDADGIIDKYEENYTADESFQNGDRRYF